MSRGEGLLQVNVCRGGRGYFRSMCVAGGGVTSGQCVSRRRGYFRSMCVTGGGVTSGQCVSRGRGYFRSMCVTGGGVTSGQCVSRGEGLLQVNVCHGGRGYFRSMCVTGEGLLQVLLQVNDTDAQQISIKVSMHCHRKEACQYPKTPFKAGR